MSDAKAEADTTARHLKLDQMAMREEMRAAATRVKRMRFWVTLAVSVAGAGFAAATYLYGTFAKSSTVDAHEVRITDVEKSQVGQEKAIENVRRVAEDAKKEATDTHDDVRWIMRQAASTAHAVRAPVEPLPEHEKKKVQP